LRQDIEVGLQVRRVIRHVNLARQLEKTLFQPV